MNRRLITALFLSLGAITTTVADSPPPRTALLGTWEFKQPGAVTSFVGYTTYYPDGRCVQIGRGKTLGMTKWIFVETGWRLEGDQVVASVTRSNVGIPVGKSSTSRILRLTESDFTYRESGDSSDRTEHRVAEVPPEFQKQLEALQQKTARK